MKILCFGDSLTRGVSYVNGRLRILKNNYPKMLQELFLENSKSEDDNQILVINKGVFNDNSDRLIERLDHDVIAEHPDYVIIEIGGNDCDFKWSEVAENPNAEHSPTVPLDRYVSNLTSIIDKVKSAGMTPILSTLPPLDPVRYYNRITDNVSSKVSDWICKVGGIEHWHTKYNRAIEVIAEELDVIKVDVRNAFKDVRNIKEFISDDGIHLTEKGYELVAKELYQSISYKKLV